MISKYGLSLILLTIACTLLKIAHVDPIAFVFNAIIAGIGALLFVYFDNKK